MKDAFLLNTTFQPEKVFYSCASIDFSADMLFLNRFKYTPLPCVFSNQFNNDELSFLDGLNIKRPRTLFSYVYSESVLFYALIFDLFSSVYFFLFSAGLSTSGAVPSVLCLSLLNFVVASIGLFALKARNKRALLISIGYQATQLAIFSALSVLSISLMGDISACKLLQNLFDWDNVEFEECTTHKTLLFGVFFSIVTCQLLVEVLSDF